MFNSTTLRARTALNSRFGPSLRWAGAGVCLCALAVLVACGGGGGADATTAGSNTGGNATASAYTSGAISGFGSIIVNGVRFDDSSADVLDDDGVRHGRDELKLGTQVEIESGSLNRTTQRASASIIRFGSALLGPVEAINAASNQLTVLGQTVEVATTTVFSDGLSGGLSAITTGMVLEVHARLDTARAVYVATRIEAETSATAYQVRGTVASLDTTAKTFRIGTAVINYASVATVPTGLANGSNVRASLQTTAVNGQWVATTLKSAERKVGNHSESEVHGLITAFTSATAFSVDGLAVDATNASFPDGQTGVVLGARVEVEGPVVNGVLVATKVSVEDESHDGRGEDYELHGAISGLDTTAKTFTLRTLKVSYASVTLWRGITEAQLANGATVEVKGSLSADRSTLTASRISRED
ncbi:DUF5666 domain-containing protein [Ideonella margarita]|uniref:DUF5666 domain-containing protein n=1 Tax=Ideonella margarita TaxID=2984191 RepID=A0ABU9C038_9BURK